MRSPTKMENGAKRGVLVMKKHCWEIDSSPQDLKVFIRNQTLNSHLNSRFFLVLPTVHPFDGWVSLEEIYMKSNVARKKLFLYLMFNFLISQSQLMYYPNKICSLCKFQFFVLQTKQPLLSKCNLIDILDFQSRALVFSFCTIFLKTTAKVCCVTMVHVSVRVACAAQ